MLIFLFMLQCFTQFNLPLEGQTERSLCSLQMKGRMFGAVDTPTCLRRNELVNSFTRGRFTGHVACSLRLSSLQQLFCLVVKLFLPRFLCRILNCILSYEHILFYNFYRISVFILTFFIHILDICIFWCMTKIVFNSQKTVSKHLT